MARPMLKLCLPPRQTVAEREAWKLAKEHGFDLVTVQPSYVIGPVLGQRADATTVQTLIV